MVRRNCEWISLWKEFPSFPWKAHGGHCDIRLLTACTLSLLVMVHLVQFSILTRLPSTLWTPCSVVSSYTQQKYHHKIWWGIIYVPLLQKKKEQKKWLIYVKICFVARAMTLVSSCSLSIYSCHASQWLMSKPNVNDSQGYQPEVVCPEYPFQGTIGPYREAFEVMQLLISLSTSAMVWEESHHRAPWSFQISQWSFKLALRRDDFLSQVFSTRKTTWKRHNTLS